ncbi:hypothetical protein CK203_061756 [Vitis vinifera]|uniref:Uncharacterized protein n=1 Tax=Vitis vinifera TaxID=29760 RepID=A0A438GSN2_VITVI|nr:hypothetical protein CK203_061756 [Vitis vinifera]
MASESFVQPAIPCFDGHYHHWNAQKTELEGLKLKDLKAMNYLFQAIDRSILETILCMDTAKHIRDSMKKKYQVEVIEDEKEAEVEVKEAEITMIMGTNNKIIIIKRVNFKEKAKDVETITQQLIDQVSFISH